MIMFSIINFFKHGLISCTFQTRDYCVLIIFFSEKSVSKEGKAAERVQIAKLILSQTAVATVIFFTI